MFITLKQLVSLGLFHISALISTISNNILFIPRVFFYGVLHICMHVHFIILLVHTFRILAYIFKIKVMFIYTICK